MPEPILAAERAEPILFKLYRSLRFYDLIKQARAYLLDEELDEERRGIHMLIGIAYARVNELDKASRIFERTLKEFEEAERLRDDFVDLRTTMQNSLWIYGWAYEFIYLEAVDDDSLTPEEHDMTRHRDFKRLVRTRMSKTGESYASARRQLLGKRKAGSLVGWVVTGPGDHLPGFELTDYVGELDPNAVYGGKPSAVLYSTVDKPDSYAVIMQTLDAVPYRGERVRFSAWIRCEADTEDAELWMLTRSIGDHHPSLRGSARPATSWQHVAVVLDVDQHSDSMRLGLSLKGEGRVWMNDACFEKVDETVPVTTESGRSQLRRPKELPFNLDFTYEYDEE